MIELNILDDKPPNAVITEICGDVVCYYFEDDAKVIDMKKAQAHEIKLHQRQEVKQRRVQSINRIIITTSTGNIFNGDETSQQRMHRAIDVMAENESIEWILADNKLATVTRSELHEALRLAFLKQSALHISQNET